MQPLIHCKSNQSKIQPPAIFRKVTTVSLLLAFFILFSMSACNRSTRTFFQEGVSQELAKYRSRQIYDVSYQLYFDIPAERSSPVTGNVVVRFKPLKARHGLILDFTPGEENVHSLTVNGKDAVYNVMKGHIYIDANHLVPRQENSVEISFTSSDQSLNRSDDFMYTLFVPDRASSAFPCFDQPDIKARYSLSLTVPEDWVALANGPEESTTLSDSRKTITFLPDQPISTYLFAFTAGKYDVVSETRDGQTIRIFHRETDRQKIDRNIPAIFNQHFDALQWLTEYTAIPYPYAKFDMALIPGFQYSGMEHPGAVWYRDSRLLLERNAPLATRIRKASLIAHETAHMWFGNLVTMVWFDDVWLKEVFAGFMADKMTELQFPDENHALRFMMAHYPSAKGIDRSAGTHPIKQELNNMKLAGTLYGAIIYNKAPIVFQQLEQIMEPKNFQMAVREYLATFSHGNADWDDLVRILDKYSQQNIVQWSNAWVYGKGIPHIQVKRSTDEPGAFDLAQVSHSGEKHFPAQLLGLTILSEGQATIENIWFDSALATPSFSSSGELQLVVPNGAGIGYGYFELQSKDVDFISENLSLEHQEILRAASYLAMYENFLNDKISSLSFFYYIYRALSYEEHSLLQQNLLGNLVTWALNYPEYSNHDKLIEITEDLLWRKLSQASATEAEMFFDAWLVISRSPSALDKMEKLYSGELKAGNFMLAEDNYTRLALEMALRNPSNNRIIETEKRRIRNPDRLRRFNFILPAVSASETERDQFFESLKTPENRRPEPWVLDALHYLHHPARKGQGLKYVAESLSMLPEIQITGDIFFPLNWLQATLKNYNDPQVAALVSDYLEQTPDLNDNLRLKVLQAADINFRSAAK